MIPSKKNTRSICLHWSEAANGLCRRILTNLSTRCVSSTIYRLSSLTKISNIANTNQCELLERSIGQPDACVRSPTTRSSALSTSNGKKVRRVWTIWGTIMGLDRSLDGITIIIQGRSTSRDVIFNSTSETKGLGEVALIPEVILTKIITDNDQENNKFK